MEITEKKVTVDVSIDENVKIQAEELFDELGMDLSTAINIFLHQCVYENRIPFIIKLD